MSPAAPTLDTSVDSGVAAAPRAGKLTSPGEGGDWLVPTDVTPINNATAPNSGTIRVPRGLAGAVGKGEVFEALVPDKLVPEKLIAEESGTDSAKPGTLAKRFFSGFVFS